MKTLQIITTGGTIDKIYYDEKSDYKIGEPEIARILTDMNVAFRWHVQPLLRKDSLELTDEDRALIRSAVKASDAKHFLITHGTDTMVETARALQELEGRTIVLTGALNPARFLGSDAVFNIGCAVSAVQTVGEGVWIAMNGRIWDPRKVRKNRDANRFEAI
ncbi:MAG: asparaginase domain-containing protein [Wenzhouxiangellaceae bacterium]|nr:asparaginase domain-containing protein [Wenzhouxiangellaceae bacterium]